MAQENKSDQQKWLYRLHRTEQINKEKRAESIRYKKAYTGDFKNTRNSDVGKYTIKVNFIYYLVETILPTLFNGEPKIKVKPKRDPALAQGAKLLEYNTNYWAKELDARAEFKDCLLDAFFGPAAMYTGWRYEVADEKGERPKMGPMGVPLMDASGQPVMEEYDIVLKDEPIIRWLDFWEDIRVDPDVKRTRHARWVAIRVTVPEDEFYSMQTIKKEYREGDKKIKATMRPEDANERERSYTEGKEENKSDAEWITYWEIWDKEKKQRCLVHEQVTEDYLNEDTSWPYDFEYRGDVFPVTFLHAKQDPFGPMSFSEFKPIEDSIWERVRLRSIQAAQLRRLAPKIIFNKAAATKEQMKKFLTSDIMSANEVNNPAMIMMAPMPEIPPAFLQWDNILQQDLGNISGLAEFENQRLANTATEASISEGRQNVRKSARNQAFENFVATVLGKVSMLTQQLQNMQTTMLIDGDSAQAAPQVFNISKEQIQGEFSYDIVPGSMEHNNEEVQNRNLMRFYELSLNDPGANHQYLIEEIAESLGLEPRLVLLSPEQKAKNAQDAQAAEQAKAAAEIQGKVALEKEKAKPRFAPVALDAIENPATRFRIVSAAESEAGVPALSPGPAIRAQEQMAQLGQGGDIPNTGAPMNDSKNMAGNQIPQAPVHPTSMEGQR